MPSVPVHTQLRPKTTSSTWSQWHIHTIWWLPPEGLVKEATVSTLAEEGTLMELVQRDPTVWPDTRTFRLTNKRTCWIVVFHSSTLLHALACRANSGQKDASRHSLALAAALSAYWLWRKHHSSKGEFAAETSRCANTFVIWIWVPAITSSAIKVHRSALGELIFTSAPSKILRRRRTTAWQSDQIIKATPRQLANRL